MNLVLKSCKATANAITLVAVDVDHGVEVTSELNVRSCGGPFLQHDASVRQLVEDLFAVLNAAAKAPVAAVTAMAIVDDADVPAPKKGRALPPTKGAA